MPDFFNPTPQKTVTILRILYPLWTIIAAASLMYIPSEIMVPEHAKLTAENLLSNEFLYNLSLAGSLITQLIHIIMVLLFWHLFKPISQNLSGLILVFGLISVPIAMFNSINGFAANLVVNSPDFLSSFSNDQAQSWMMFFLNLHDIGILIAQIFWGLWLFPIALLIYQSGIFHKITGHFLMIAGFGYVLASFGEMIYPESTSSIVFSIFTIMSMGEILFMLWLVIRGARSYERLIANKI
jgi:hypothetical protein